MNAYRLMSGGRAVGTILGTDRQEALTAFTRGRGLPASVDLSIWEIHRYETRRPRAKKGHR